MAKIATKTLLIFVAALGWSASFTLFVRGLVGPAFGFLLLAGLATTGLFPNVWSWAARKLTQVYVLVGPRVQASARTARAHAATHQEEYFLGATVLAAAIFFLCYCFGSKPMPFYRNGWFLASLFFTVLAISIVITKKDGWGAISTWLSSGRHLFYLWTGVSVFMAVLAINYDWSTGSKVFWVTSAVLSVLSSIITYNGLWKETGRVTKKGLKKAWGSSWKVKCIVIGVLIMLYGAYVHSDVSQAAGTFYGTVGLVVILWPAIWAWIKWFAKLEPTK